MSSIRVISRWIWSRSNGVMNVLCSSVIVSCVTLSAARSAPSMCWACISSSLKFVIIAASSRLPSTILSACALKSSKKWPSWGISRPNMEPPCEKCARILYHAGRAKPLALGTRESEPVAVYLGIVRTRRGARRAHFARRCGEPRHDARHGDRAEVLVLRACNRPARAEMRVVEDLAVRVDRRDRHAGFRQPRDDLGERARADPARDDLVQLV